MVVQVNQELCAGCGVCVETCTEGAIQLVDDKAVIDSILCRLCEACIDACPNGAITVVSIPEHNSAMIKPPVIETSPVAVRNQPELAESEAPVYSLAPLVGTGLTFLGKEVVPRLVDVLFAALERRLARPTITTISSLSSSQMDLTTHSRGKHRRTRNQRGRKFYKNHKERR
jgi:NAD-dependent dihydropyrimidine dehydrogenase PreA subunit